MRDVGPSCQPSLERLIADSDWEGTPLGPRSQWPSSLRNTVDVLLRSDAEIVLFWGPEFIAIYNDAYAPTIGDKHPRALGRPARENWSELWDDLGPLLSGVRETGRTFSAKNRPFYIERHGFGESVWFDISYSAVPDEHGGVGGVLCIVSETTDRMLAERRLAESERRLRALVNATSDIVFRVSADWSTMIPLDGKDLLADTNPTVPWAKQLIPPEDRALVKSTVARAIVERSAIECEHRIHLKGGRSGWVQSRAVPILDEGGSVVEWFGTASDVTVRRQQRAHLEVVVHELDHRVKNTLAMVQAIARQTFRPGVDLVTAQAVFDERLKAIAQANALLTGEKGVGASLRQAVEQAVRPHCPAPSRLQIEGGDVALTPKTALAVILAKHELATNALKYGAWSGQEGRVDITFGVERKGERRTIAIEWKERGGPPVREPTRRGFGSKLIERGLAAELDGQVELRFEPDGLRCSMRARLSPGEQA